MKIDQKKIETVETWFHLNFPGHEVESEEIGNRKGKVVLIWAELLKPRAPRYELEISYEAIQDHDAQTIVNDLNAMKAAEHLDSSFRLLPTEAKTHMLQFRCIVDRD